MWENPQNVEAAIRRLTREIEEIDSYFYMSQEASDRHAYAGMLERKRDDMVRSAVLQSVLSAKVRKGGPEGVIFAVLAFVRLPRRDRSADVKAWVAEPMGGRGDVVALVLERGRHQAEGTGQDWFVCAWLSKPGWILRRQAEPTWRRAVAGFTRMKSLSHVI